jgi:hypothetical protein
MENQLSISSEYDKTNHARTIRNSLVARLRKIPLDIMARGASGNLVLPRLELFPIPRCPISINTNILRVNGDLIRYYFKPGPSFITEGNCSVMFCYARAEVTPEIYFDIPQQHTILLMHYRTQKSSRKTQPVHLFFPVEKFTNLSKYVV